ncbi:MAG: class I adenylate-forming enzyme family protein [Desulfopila sp.]
MKTTCTLKTLLAQGCERGQDNPAIIFAEKKYSFKTFRKRIFGMSNALLDLGLKKGDRVALLTRNSIESAESYFSVTHAGLVLVMLNSRLAPVEIRTILRDSKASVLLITEEYADHIEQISGGLTFLQHTVLIGSKQNTPAGWLHYETLIESGSDEEPMVDIFEDDLAALMYTSGTTGVPKGCMVGHRNLYHVGKSMSLEMHMGPNDLGIIPVPLFHASGQCLLMSCIFSDIPSVIMPCWDIVKFMELVKKYRATAAMLATPMLFNLVNHSRSDQYEFGSIEKILFAGAPVSPILLKKAIERFGNIFIHGYGATETVGSMSILRLDEVESALAEGRTEILGSCGRNYADMEILVVDENDQPVVANSTGEIRVRGKGVTMGYWNKEGGKCDGFKGEWYYTGDLARIDGSGFVYIVGRRKDMIISGAENVFPAEIENVLLKHPAIEQVAVVGIEDEKWGEAVTAFIVQKHGEHVTESALEAFCRQEIAAYKVPKKFYLVDRLPISATGKLLKGKLIRHVS